MDLVTLGVLVFAISIIALLEFVMQSIMFLSKNIQILALALFRRNISDPFSPNGIGNGTHIRTKRPLKHFIDPR